MADTPHEVTLLLRKAANGGHIYDDELDDLRLPRQQKVAFKQAVERLASVSNTMERRGRAEQYAKAIVESLDATHETTRQYNQRRAAVGDPSAIAAVKAESESAEALAEQIYNRAHGIV